MFSHLEIKDICQEFNIECHDIGEVIDSTRNENDKRYNYQINNKYFLKISNFEGLHEKFFVDISRLISNYRSIDVYCPRLIKTTEGTFSFKIEKEGITYTCYIEEKAIYLTQNEEIDIDYVFKKEVLEHVGLLARNYSNCNLSDKKSMWSIIELCVYDKDIDEKQENFNELIECLKSFGYQDLVRTLIEVNEKARLKIKNIMNQLPKCVYQGDLNNSNLLIDEQGHFCGIIDFNMFGTEVNINCFLNESMYYIQKEDFDALSGREVFDKMKKVQQNLLSSILRNYSLNADEMNVVENYNKVIYMSFYPNVVLMINLFQKNRHKDKLIEFLSVICE